MHEDMRFSSLFEEGGSVAYRHIAKYDHPWEAIPHIRDIIMELEGELDPEDFYCPKEGVLISKGATVAPTAHIDAPAIIMQGAEIRHCAYIRGSVIVGEGAVVGNSCEIKNAVIFDGAQIPHFNYVGDSIIGRGAHLGAGAVTSNVKSDRTNVAVRAENERIATGLRKMGAILGDRVEVGCGAVLNPGTVIGRGSRIYPQCSVRGFIPSGVIYKSEDDVVSLG